MELYFLLHFVLSAAMTLLLLIYFVTSAVSSARGEELTLLQAFGAWVMREPSSAPAELEHPRCSPSHSPQCHHSSSGGGPAAVGRHWLKLSFN